jgi:integrase
MGLGAYPNVSLAKARELRDKWSELVDADEIDPIEQRKTQRAAERAQTAKLMTFDDCRKAYIEAHETAWRNSKHRAQWTSTLQTYVSPIFGKLPVQAVDTGLVLKVIEPIWSTKPETASRVRGRIESILNWARVRGHCTGENPARWRGHLDHLLPAKSKVRKVKHHPALPYEQIGAFMADLETREGIAAQALQVVILCTCRTGDIIGNNRDDKPPMLWPHVDLTVRLWAIPSTKTDTEHRVPLSDAAVGLLKKVRALELGEIVFPGMSAGEALSNMAMTNVIKRMNEDRVRRGLPQYVDPKQGNRTITVHGFRSTFRDWAAERTNVPNHVVEMALAHAISDDVEAAYRRGDLFDKRRKLMESWAAFCAKSPAHDVGKVIAIRQGVG